MTSAPTDPAAAALPDATVPGMALQAGALPGAELPFAALTRRGPALENAHLAHIAVVDARGTLRYRFGDPSRPTLPRSAIKPAQALAVLESGAFEQYGLSDADLALCCASHSSEAIHIARAQGMLEASGASENEMRCGPHAPLSEAVQREWIKSGFAPTPVCSNCSGKHAGMLAAARALKLPVGDYHLPAHPLQQRVARTIAELCDLAPEQIAWGIDGCNLPTPSFALDRLARVFAKLGAAALPAAPPTAADGTTDALAAMAPARRAALARIYHAMAGHPELVAGKGRFCSELMRAFEGTLVGKTGADASYAIACPARGLGIALKVEDGNSTIAFALAVEVLHQLDIGTPAMRARLAHWHRPQIKNTAGIVTGEIETVLRLIPA